MSLRASARLGHAVPPAPRHAVTVQMPEWKHIQQFCTDPRGLIASFHNAYPRMKPHRDIAQLTVAVLEYLGLSDTMCFLFGSLQTARECVEYAVSPRRDDGIDRKPLDPSAINIRCIRAKDHFYAVVFPQSEMAVMSTFWITPGVGISSRFAEENLDYIDHLLEAAIMTDHEIDSSAFDTKAHLMLRKRIVYYLNRAALDVETNAKVQPDDIYFVPTGMATIYKTHTYLSMSPQNAGTTVLFGMAFMNTVAAFQEFSDGYKFLGLGTDEDLSNLESFLADERSSGRKIQAIWAEFPANPVLVTPNIVRLRELADEYDTILIIDDTIGSFANIDVLPTSDILVTSLTKTFNGYADAIAGSIILNPSSKHYTSLKALFQQHHVPELYHADADVIEHNSRDYLTRTAKLNHNADILTTYLHNLSQNDPQSPIKRIHYPNPSINESGTSYVKFLRPSTPDFQPGYGCLFNIEFKTLPGAIAFYDNINIYNGPHLGAPFTLAFAYTMIAYGNKLDWAAEMGLYPTQIRVSVGLEDIQDLIKTFGDAVEVARLAELETKVRLMMGRVYGSA